MKIKDTYTIVRTDAPEDIMRCRGLEEAIAIVAGKMILASDDPAYEICDRRGKVAYSVDGRFPEVARKKGPKK